MRRKFSRDAFLYSINLAFQNAIQPLSTIMLMLVTNWLARSEAKKSTVPATSEGRPNRGIAVLALLWALKLKSECAYHLDSLTIIKQGVTGHIWISTMTLGMLHSKFPLTNDCLSKLPEINVGSF